jgi:hypothetical protein
MVSDRVLLVVKVNFMTTTEMQTFMMEMHDITALQYAEIPPLSALTPTAWICSVHPECRVHLECLALVALQIRSPLVQRATALSIHSSDAAGSAKASKYNIKSAATSVCQMFFELRTLTGFVAVEVSNAVSSTLKMRTAPIQS